MGEVAVRSWGNSLGIRIPKDLRNRFQICASDVLEYEVKEDVIIFRKQIQHKSFEKRLEEYGGKISVLEYDWGEPEGREML